MTVPDHAVLLFAAGAGAGVMNAVAGGGSFLTFPALVFAGLRPPRPGPAARHHARRHHGGHRRHDLDLLQARVFLGAAARPDTLGPALCPHLGSCYRGGMAELKVRQLEDRVATALRLRADRRGVSLEEEVRSTLTAVVNARREAFARRAAASRKMAGDQPGAAALDSARLIRKTRDARG